MVVQCCVCKRVRVENDWVRVANPEAIARVASHGYCPACFAQMYALDNALTESMNNVPPAA